MCKWVFLPMLWLGISYSTAQSAVFTWTGTSDSLWSNPTNWSPVGVPGNSDDAIISSGTYSPNLQGITSVGGITLSNLTLNLAGGTITILGDATFSSGNVINGILNPTSTSNLIFAGTTFDCLISGDCIQLQLNGSVFNQPVTLNRIGTGPDVGTGLNIFNSTLNLTNAGTGSLVLGSLSEDVFQGNVEITAAGGSIVFGSAGLGTQFNGDIIINSTLSLANEEAIQFGSNERIYLDIGKTLTIGSTGWSGGILRLKGFELGGPSDVFPLNLTVNSAIEFSNHTLIPGAMNVVAGEIYFNGIDLRPSTGSSSFEQIAHSTVRSLGGNHFGGANLSFIQSGNGEMVLGAAVADTFHNGCQFIFENRGDGDIRIAQNSTGNLIQGDFTLNNDFGSATANRKICIADSGSIEISSQLTVFNSASAGVFFGTGGGQTQVSFSGGFFHSSSLFSNGVFDCNHVSFGAMSNLNATFLGTATVNLGPGSNFLASVDIESPSILLNGARFISSCSLKKTGSNHDYSNGGNYWSGNLILFENAGAGNMVLGYQSADSISNSSSLTYMLTSGTGDIYFASRSSGNFISSQVMASLNAGGSGTQRSIYFGSRGTLTFDSPAILQVSNPSSDGGIFLGSQGSFPIPGGFWPAITFRPGSTIRTTYGFNYGTFSIQNTTFIAGSPQDFSLDDSTHFVIGPFVVANDSFKVTAPNIYLNGVVFNGLKIEITKTGPRENICNGGNVFNGTCIITNQSSGDWLLSGAINGDVYYGVTTFNCISTGQLDFCYRRYTALLNHLYLNYTSNFYLGTQGGTLTFSGAGNQIMDCLGPGRPTLARMELNNLGAGLTLMDSLRISSSATFNTGNVHSSMVSPLHFLDDATANSANDLSFVAGPVLKEGNDAFLFPIGKANRFVPLQISPPGNFLDRFCAEYLDYDPHGLYSRDLRTGGLTGISACDYFNLERQNGSSAVMVSLGWNFSPCLIANVSDLVVAHWTGSTWENEGVSSTTGNTNIGMVSSAAVISTFSPFALGSINATSSLPIHIQNFEAKTEVKGVVLNWTCETQLEGYHFSLEKSVDGIDFQYLTKALLNDKTKQMSQYQSVDSSPTFTFTVYKLTLIDPNGQNIETAFAEIYVQISEGEIGLPFPNPLQKGGTQRIPFLIENDEEWVSIQLSDEKGRILHQKRMFMRRGKQEMEYDFSALSSGLYFWTLTIGQRAESFKVVLE